MKVKIGNIPPNSEIEIIYSYLQELEVSLNKFWRYTIPSTLTPRYESSNSKDSKVTENLLDLGSIKTTQQNAYTWSIAVDIFQTTKITVIDSPSHKLLLTFKNQEETQLKLMVENEQGVLLPNKDFVLIFRNDQIIQPQAMLGLGKNNQMCAMISFVPDFANCQLDDALKQSLSQSQSQDDPNDFPVNFDAARSEYIFLIDRSGSMGGQRIQYAKEALFLFLKSMPNQTYFNIFSFGSQFDSIFPSSVKYETEKVDFAIQQVQIFEANYGGTQIYQPLVKILTEQQRIKGFPRQVFLLTDGDVSNPNQVIQLIQQNNKFNRVHSIGIGSGASTYLIKQCAKAGKGNSIFVQNNQDISSSIIKLLRYSVTPCLDNFVFSYDQQIIDSIIPAPHNIPCILKNQPFIMYLFFKPGIVQGIKTQVTLTCSDSALNQNLTFFVEINQEVCMQTGDAFKLGIFKMIKCLSEKLLTNNQKVEDDILLSKKINLKEEIVDLSIKHQILSKETAFLCVINEIADENAHLVQNQSQNQKIIIPQLVSADYKQQIDKQKNFYNIPLPSIHSYQQSPWENGLFGASHNVDQLGAQFRNNQDMSFPTSVPKQCQSAQPKQQQNYQAKNQNNLLDNFSYQQSVSQDLFGAPHNYDQFGAQFLSNQGFSFPMSAPQQFQQVQPQKQNNLLDDFTNLQFSQEEKKNYSLNFSFGPQLQQSQKFQKMNNSEIFKIIVNSVKLEGFWSYDMQLLSQIIKNPTDFNNTIPLNIQYQNPADYWMTILILAWLQTKSIQNKNEWLMIGQKVENWLTKYGTVWKSFLPKAQSLLM